MSAGGPAGLAPALKALGLSGMSGTLEARLAEARAGTLGHAEFLQVLCEDELARRDAAKITRRIKAAHFPGQATLETFDFGYNPGCPPPRSATWPGWSSSTPGKGSSPTGRSAPASPTWPPRWATRPAAAATTSPSPPAPGCSPTWPAGTPTAASRPASASSPGSPC